MWRFHPSIKLREILLIADYGLREDMKAPVPWHNGIDVSVGDGDEIPCFVDDVCKVEKVNPFLLDEGTVVITDVNNWEYVFAHLDNVRVKEGDLIQFGTILGNQDSEGQSVQTLLRSLWQHLHFAVRKIDDVNGKQARFWPYGHKYENVDNGLDGFVDPNVNCEKVIKRVAEAIAMIEGFTSGKSRVAVENNNPGNLRWSPFAKGKRNGFAYFENVSDGWKALIWDLEQKIKGNTRTKLNGKSTILEFCRVWAPKEDGNNPFKYAENLVRICGFRSLNDRIEDWLLTELDWVRKYNNYSQYEKSAGKWFSSLVGLFFNYLWNKAFKGRN